MRWIPMLLSYVAFGLALPFLVTHPKLRHGLGARLGLYRRGWPQLASGVRIWCHGASAGDILALRPTMAALKAQRPDVRVVVSTLTHSGRAMADRHRDLFDAVTYLPYDLPDAVFRAFKRIKPHLLVLEYTELWPQLLHAAHRRGIPVVLHNGRLAETLVASYRWLFRCTGNLLTLLSLLLMRDEAEAQRALALGAPRNRLYVTGNTKFDNLLQDPCSKKITDVRGISGFSDDALVWVAGSTHEGEEELLLETLGWLRRRCPQLCMILAPRYTQRCKKIMAFSRHCGFQTRLRSQADPSGVKAPVDVLILDSIGELAACYALATVVFVGGSLVPRGGQNILEPAAWGKPVVFGPHMHNFAEAVKLLLGRGGLQVSSQQQLQHVLYMLLRQPAYRQELGETAQKHVKTLQGAAYRNACLIQDVLPIPWRLQKDLSPQRSTA